jgi:hypothetical protein
VVNAAIAMLIHTRRSVLRGAPVRARVRVSRPAA